MIDKFNVRTDLALEEKERFESDDVEISGVVLEEHYDEQKEIRITMVKIETEKGGKNHGEACRELPDAGGTGDGG